MLARRQEINTQLQQIIDSFLLGLTLYATIRPAGLRDAIGLASISAIDPFSNYHWLVVVVMAFGPILLDLQGYYHFPLTKTLWRSFRQVVQAMIVRSASWSVRASSFFASPSRIVPVPLLFIGFGTAVLLIKERIIVACRPAPSGTR